MATAAPTAVEAPAPAKGKKKLIMIVAAVLVLAVGGGGAAMMMMKKKPAEGDAGADHAPAAAAVSHDPKAPPVFVPLDPFTVNLADRQAERYAQIGITLEIGDAKAGDQIKLFMPAIRNNILMAIADRSSTELLDRDGKTKLAEKIRREASRALGYEVADDDEEDTDAEAAPTKKKKKKKAEPVLPIRAVHFSNFIIQ